MPHLRNNNYAISLPVTNIIFLLFIHLIWYNLFISAHGFLRQNNKTKNYKKEGDTKHEIWLLR